MCSYDEVQVLSLARINARQPKVHRDWLLAGQGPELREAVH